MFVTVPEFAQRGCVGLSADGSRFWRAIELTGHLPWFIVTMSVEEDGQRLRRNLLLSWGEDVAGLADGCNADSFCTVQYVEPPLFNPQGSWRLRDVRRIWRVRSPDRTRTGPLVFEATDGEFCEPFSGAEPVQGGYRDLVVEVASTVHAPEVSR
jgi:hypothetical protein